MVLMMGGIWEVLEDMVLGKIRVKRVRWLVFLGMGVFELLFCYF